MFEPFQSTGIGSLPHQSVDEALELVLENTDIAFWPQLPKRSALEQMVPQYIEGLPGIRLQGDTPVVEPTEDDMNSFYEQYSEDKLFPISRNVAEGFYRFLDVIPAQGLSIVKGHVTGPVTLSLALKYTDTRPVYFDEEYREVLLMVLKGKTRWQIQQLRQAGASRIIIFIDEPVLTALGSSTYLSVGPAEAIRLINELVQVIKAEGAIAGVHCCGRADWAQVLDTGVDILNFDAYGYFESLKASADVLESFLDSGGYLAWGIVPTTEAINSEDRDGLLRRLEGYIRQLKDFVPEEVLLRASLLTPSCGAGSRTIDEAERVFSLLRQLREAMK